MLRLEQVRVAFRSTRTRAADGVSLNIRPGETLALVGESGSGKTTLGRVAVGLLEPDEGEVLLDDRPFQRWRREQPRAWRRALQMVFQDPDASMPHHLPVRRVLLDALTLADLPDGSARLLLAELLDEMELPEELLDRRPRELSGGERQRVALARAFAPRPRLVVLDEPTSAVDAMLRGRILDLLKHHQERHGTAYLLITHDLEAASSLARELLILQNGRVVESGPPGAILGAPRHPYTRRLAASLPSRDPRHRRIITGAASNPEGSRAPRKNTTPKEVPLSTVTLQLDYYHPWSNNAGFYLARERGYYLEHGVDVEIHISDPFRGDSIAQVVRCKGDFAVNYPNRLFVQRELGVRVRSVAALNRGPLEALMTLPDRNIHRPKDLENRRVGIPRSPRLTALLRYLVRRDGGDPDRVVPVEYYPPEPLPTDIARGDIDATLGTLWAWEAPLGREAGLEPVVLKTEEIGSPRFHAQLLITRESLIEANPVLVRRFLAATARGFTDAARDIDAAVRVLQRAAPYFGRSLLEDALTVTAPTWATGGEWGTHVPELMEGYARFLLEVGLLRSLEPVAGSYTDGLLA